MPGLVLARSSACVLILMALGSHNALAYNYLTCSDGTPLFNGGGEQTFEYADNLSTAQKAAISTGLARVTESSAASITVNDSNDSSYSSGNGQSEIYIDLGVGTADCAVWFFDAPTCRVTEADIRFGDEPWTTDEDSNHWPYSGAGRSMVGTAVHEGGHCVGMAHSNDLYNMMGQDWNHVTRNGSVSYYGPGEDLSAGLIDLHGKRSASDTFRDIGVTVFRYSGSSGAYSRHSAGLLRDATGSEFPTAGSFLGQSVYRVQAGATVQMELTFENNGEMDAESPNIGYYLSDNSVISATDTLVHTQDGLALLRDAPLETTVSFSIPAQTPPGNYFLGAYADHDDLINETTVANNVAYYPVTVTPAAADLIVIAPGVTSATLAAGEAFTASATARNAGGLAASAGSTLRYYRSVNATISAFDTELASDAIPLLAAGANSVQSALLSAPAVPGDYWIGACVDSVDGESSTANQCSSAVAITVTPPAPDAATLQPGEVDVFQATLNAQVNPNGLATTVYFDLGESTAYGSTLVYGGVGAGIDPVAVAVVANNLACATTFNVRVRAVSSAGTSLGQNRQFTTAACPPGC